MKNSSGLNRPPSPKNSAQNSHDSFHEIFDLLSENINLIKKTFAQKTLSNWEVTENVTFCFDEIQYIFCQLEIDDSYLAYLSFIYQNMIVIIKNYREWFNDRADDCEADFILVSEKNIKDMCVFSSSLRKIILATTQDRVAPSRFEEELRKLSMPPKTTRNNQVDLAGVLLLKELRPYAESEKPAGYWKSLIVQLIKENKTNLE